MPRAPGSAKTGLLAQLARRAASKRSGWRVLGGLGLWLAGCQPDQPAQQPPATPLRPATGLTTAGPAASPPGVSPAAAGATELPIGPLLPQFAERRADAGAPRRYVGLVGGQPATAELSWARPDSVAGRFYFWRRNAEYQLASPARRSTQVLAVARASSGSVPASGQWRLAQPPGAVLQGTWVDAAGQRQPFVLHEDYRGGVRYEMLTSTLTLPVDEEHRRSPEYHHDFMHLLGPAAGRLPLRRAQCPPRAGRRQFVRDFPHDEQVTCTYTTEVLLNDFQLLSYQTEGHVDPFEGQDDWEVLNTLVDLTTGRELALEAQLRPGYERPLRRLLSRHLRHDPGYSENEPGSGGWHWQDADGRPTKLGPLPNGYEGLGLARQGLQATFGYPSLHGGGGDGRPTYKVLIPYRELRPLVRPGTPLARMVRARGL